VALPREAAGLLRLVASGDPHEGPGRSDVLIQAGVHDGKDMHWFPAEILEAGTISIHDDRWFTYPWGVNGGTPGARSQKILERADGSREVLPSKCDRIHVKEGDLLHYITWGGGGWGDPLERDADLVALEVKRGLISFEGAKRYGVVLTQSSDVDQKATEALRKDMAEKRGEVEVFDFGPDIETLRKSCKKETGLPAPVQPVWD